MTAIQDKMNDNGSKKYSETMHLFKGVGVADFQLYNLVCSDIVVSKELHVNSEEYKQDQ